MHVVCAGKCGVPCSLVSLHLWFARLSSLAAGAMRRMRWQSANGASLIQTGQHQAIEKFDWTMAGSDVSPSR